MFVARNRLIVHNLPLQMDNNKLKELFIKYSRPNAVIKVSKNHNLCYIILTSHWYQYVTFHC